METKLTIKASQDLTKELEETDELSKEDPQGTEEELNKLLGLVEEKNEDKQ